MKIRRHTVRLRGLDWAYYTVGSGSPMVVVPPFHADIERLAPVLTYLGKYFFVISPELPGIATPTPFTGYPHTSNTYAIFIGDFIKRLRLRDYVMLAISFGGVIAIRMLEIGVVSPRKLVMYGVPLDAAHIHLSWGQRIVLSSYQIVAKNKRRAETFARYFFGTPWIISAVFAIKFIGQKQYWKIVAHQTRLTVTIHPKAWVELLKEIFSLRLSEEPLQFTVPALLVYHKHDNMLDVPQAVAGMRRIFPNSQTIIIPEGLHAPVAPITEKEAAIWVSALLPMIHV